MPRQAWQTMQMYAVMQGSLGGNAKTVMIANISPAQASAAETHNTLDFATRAKCVKNRVHCSAATPPFPVCWRHMLMSGHRARCIMTLVSGR